MYFNSGLFGSAGGFGSAAVAAAAAAAHSMSPGGGGGGAAGGSAMSHHIFDAAAFRNEHGFSGQTILKWQVNFYSRKINGILYFSVCVNPPIQS